MGVSAQMQQRFLDKYEPEAPEAPDVPQAPKFPAFKENLGFVSTWDCKGVNIN